MKGYQRLSVISEIQKNIKQMQSQAQQYLTNNHNNLPSICKPRHYLFQTIELKNEPDIQQSKQEVSKKALSKLNVQINNSKDIFARDQRRKMFNPRASVYNIQFNKKVLNQRTLQERARQQSTIMMNSTSLRMRMSGVWRGNNRYFKDSPYKPFHSLQHNSSDNKNKLKTIIFNSQVIQNAEKDLKLANNTQSSARALNKLQLSKKQSQLLRKYFSQFKHLRSTQFSTSNEESLINELEKTREKIVELENYSSRILEKVLPEEISKNSRKKACKLYEQSKQKLIRGPKPDYNNSLTDQVSTRKKVKLKPAIKFDRPEKIRDNKPILLLDEECTPWGYEEQTNNFDFS